MYTRISARHPNTTVHAFSAKPSEFGLSDNKKASFVEHCRLHPSFDNRQSVYTARHLYVNQKKKTWNPNFFCHQSILCQRSRPAILLHPIARAKQCWGRESPFRSVCSLHYERIMRNLRPKSRSPHTSPGTKLTMQSTGFALSIFGSSHISPSNRYASGVQPTPSQSDCILGGNTTTWLDCHLLCETCKCISHTLCVSGSQFTEDC